MAAIRSLGVHSPSALPYLVAEGILPPSPDSSRYSWKTYNDEASTGSSEEEILIADSCVVYSRDGMVNKVFRFDVEAQQVHDAFLTSIWTYERFNSSIVSGTDENFGHTTSTNAPLEPTPARRRKSGLFVSGVAHAGGADGDEHSKRRLSRVLVVFLKLQAHVFILSGPSYVVNLPFEVDMAFPTPNGLLIQRKLSTQLPSSSSLFSNPLPGPSLSTLLEPQTKKPQSNAWVDYLKGGTPSITDELPRHFSFVDPLSEVGLVVTSPVDLRSLKPSNTPEYVQAFEALDKSESIIYSSPHDELRAVRQDSQGPFILVVTVNEERRTFSFWMGSYVDQKSLKDQIDTRQIISDNRLRRRSSFGTTGSRTPMGRSRDPRESLSGSARQKSASAALNPAAGLSHEHEYQTTEDLMASQLEIDAQTPRLSRHPSRRVSSLLSRVDVSTGYERTSFQDATSAYVPGSAHPTSARRGSERTSLGGAARFRARPSTPGFRPSVGGRYSLDGSLDELMLHDTHSDDVDGLNSQVMSWKQSDFDPLGFQSPLDGLRKEFVLTKFKEISTDASSTSSRGALNFSQARPRVFTSAHPKCGAHRNATLYRLLVHIIFKTRELQHVVLEISASYYGSVPGLHTLSNSTPSFHCAVSSIKRLKGHIDVNQICSRGQNRVMSLMKDRSGKHVLSLRSSWSSLPPYTLKLDDFRLFNTSETVDRLSSPRKEGRRRYLRLPHHLTGLEHPGSDGTVCLKDNDGRFHKLQIRFGTGNSFVTKLLDVCNFVLPEILFELLQRIFWYHGHSSDADETGWAAYVTALFALVFASEGSKGLASMPSKTRFSYNRHQDDVLTRIEMGNTFGIPWTSSPAWSWTHEAVAAVKLERKPLRKKQAWDNPANLFVANCAHQARTFWKSETGHSYAKSIRENNVEITFDTISRLLISLHLFREETKLNTITEHAKMLHWDFPCVLAQLGYWLGWDDWNGELGGFFHLESNLIELTEFERFPLFEGSYPPRGLEHPPSIFSWVQQFHFPGPWVEFPTMAFVPIPFSQSAHRSFSSDSSNFWLRKLTPRTIALSRYFRRAVHAVDAAGLVEAMAECGLTRWALETLPECVVAPLQESIVRCQANPPTNWNKKLLKLVGREDITLLLREADSDYLTDIFSSQAHLSGPVRDVRSVCQASKAQEQPNNPDVDNHTVSRLIFSEDRRLLEAIKLLDHSRVPTIDLHTEQPHDSARLDAQRELALHVVLRTFSLAPALAMVFYNSRKPLLTEKFVIQGYNTSCLFKPGNLTVSLDKNQFTEDFYGWSWFHTGVSAGLSISRSTPGIDTSWIMFNKPTELNNRHAGLLLGLGLNGHLKSLAKWLSFKYLTPKHTMTSIGLLLGLSASFIGTMDMLVTRLLSVHVTRMLPVGAADLNLSPHTQTTGLMGIGLLYCETQHRRMTEVMISEIECTDLTEEEQLPDALPQESYRLAAGFALGLINLAKGNELHGLHDMLLVDRLLRVAVSPRAADTVHILDRATAGATIAIALIFMKTHNEAVASKIDIPDTIPQFDYVRPDILLLRTLARHLIMWDRIKATTEWITESLPPKLARYATLETLKKLRSKDLPVLNIITGLVWAISLRFAGSGDLQVRDFLIKYLDQLIRISYLPITNYDSKLAIKTVQNCVNLAALACATVMAGTGDIVVFRRLRKLDSRVARGTTFGFHMASHMALGLLFVGKGMYTVSTSPLAIASLICAFYPLFPSDVSDNRAHLQAFRHLWVLATTPRCLIVRDVNTQRAVSMPIKVVLSSGEERDMTAPCLLPDPDRLSFVRTASPDYWPITLDFGNPSHKLAFQQSQSIFVNRRPSGASARGLALVGPSMLLNEGPSLRPSSEFGESGWPGAGPGSGVDIITIQDLDIHGADVDHILWLCQMFRLATNAPPQGDTANGSPANLLRDIRGVLRWAESILSDPGSGGRLAWLGREVVEELRLTIWKHSRGVEERAGRCVESG